METIARLRGEMKLAKFASIVEKGEKEARDYKLNDYKRALEDTERNAKIYRERIASLEQSATTTMLDKMQSILNAVSADQRVLEVRFTHLVRDYPYVWLRFGIIRYPIFIDNVEYNALMGPLWLRYDFTNKRFQLVRIEDKTIRKFWMMPKNWVATDWYSERFTDRQNLIFHPQTNNTGVGNVCLGEAKRLVNELLDADKIAEAIMFVVHQLHDPPTSGGYNYPWQYPIEDKDGSLFAMCGCLKRLSECTYCCPICGRSGGCSYHPMHGPKPVVLKVNVNT